MFTGTQSNWNFNAIEQLENRRLMDATLVNGVLSAVGTMAADAISVSLVSGSTSQVQVNINGDVTTFNLSAINRIELHGQKGNDLLSVLNANGSFPLGVFMKGGEGNDELIGSYLTDLLYGGLGDDLLKGHRGNDFIYGQEGLDELLGDAGLDRLFGGELDDLLLGGIGNDILKGGFGNDLIRGGDGLDELFGNAGFDDLFGDLGEDFLNGGLGDDDLDGGAGIDRLIGDLGNDDFVFNKLIELIDQAIDDIGDNLF
jgi:Ca2+-binding RTX toxin-like protein